MNTNEAIIDSTWQAELSLQYQQHNNRTIITSRKHEGPLLVQKPFYPEGDVCHTYILHPPGGVVGGDKLTINVQLDSGAHALLTTPASGKFYRCDHREASQNQNIRVAGNAVIEWLPQETILFDQAKVNSQTVVELDEQARFAGWEIMCLGRPASNERFDEGYCHQNFEIRRQGRKILIERARLNGGSELLNARWGMQAYSVMGAMVVSDANNQMLALAREVAPIEYGLGSATIIGDLLICRCLGEQGIEVREYFTRIWTAIRPDWIGRQAVPPRIWNT